MNDSPAAHPASVLLQMISGCWVSQALYVAAKLGIPDLLDPGSRSCTALAESTQSHPGALYRVLRAIASVGVVADDGTGQFSLTPLGGYLRTGTPGSLRAFAIMLGEPEHWRAWEGVLHSVRTGTPAFDHVFGSSHFKYFESHPAAALVFDQAMSSRSGAENAAIVGARDFSDAGTVVEIGGGQGSLLSAILEASPASRGILFDVPHVIDAALRANGPASTSRCDFVGGDFFVEVPPGGDLYVIKKVLHDWDDGRALRILANCRRAMKPDGRLLVIEPVIPAGNGPSFNKVLDLLMLVWTSGGRERTLDEHAELLVAAGFRVDRNVATSAGVEIIEARPV